jgi:AcrR family transcriptional regulator
MSDVIFVNMKVLGSPVTDNSDTARRATYHHGDLARALVQAARAQIEQHGPEHLSLRDAARVVGVSVAAPYRHFVDRQALLAAVLTEGFNELTATTDQARRAAPDPISGLRALALAYVEFAAKSPSIYRLMFSPACQKTNYPELMAAGLRAFGVLLEAVHQGQKQGLLRAGPTRDMALAGWALCHGLASLHADGLLLEPGRGQPRDVLAQADALVNMLMHGVCTRPPTQSKQS